MDDILIFCYTLPMEYTNMPNTKADGFRGERMIVLPVETFSAYASHPLVKRLYLTDVGFFPKAERHDRIRKEGIEEYIFLYCTAGKGTVLLEGETFTLGANDAFCIPRRRGHHYFADARDPWSLLWVHFKGEDTGLYPLEERRKIHFESVYAANRMHFLFDLLFRVLEANYTEGNFIYISQVLQLILSEAYFREKSGGVQAQNKRITDIVRYMDRHLEKNLTLEALAETFGLSKSYLNALFQEYTQHAPLEFFTHLKMKRACGLLRSTEAPVYEIAAGLGYEDPYYFSRAFKKVVGVSPREYRNSEYFHYEE
jgi:AraC family transcriptional regulator of arabinose operon